MRPILLMLAVLLRVGLVGTAPPDLLADAKAELYQADPDGFTARRQELAAAARAAGQTGAWSTPIPRFPPGWPSWPPNCTNPGPAPAGSGS